MTRFTDKSARFPVNLENDAFRNRFFESIENDHFSR